MPVASYTGICIPTLNDYTKEYNNYPSDVFASALSEKEKEIFIEFENDRYGEKYTKKSYDFKIVSGSTMVFNIIDANV